MVPEIAASFFKTKHRLHRIGRSIRLAKKFIVLDVGSGDSPFPAADVLCEKFAWDDTERTAHFKQDRPLVVGDIENLPFKDHAFDFVHCSHVLEHTVNPASSDGGAAARGEERLYRSPDGFS